MEKDDRITETILTAAILIHAEAGKGVSLPAQLYCQAFSGGTEATCRSLFDSIQHGLIQKGLVEKLKDGPGLSDAGKKELESIRKDLASAGDGLDRKIGESLYDVAGKKQAAIFQDRATALFAFLEKLEQWPMMKPDAESITAALVFRLGQLIDCEASIRTQKIRDLLDLTYSRAVVVKHEVENPQSPKKVDPSRIEWNKIDRGLFHGRVQAWLRTGPLHLNLLRINAKHHRLLTLDCSSNQEDERSLKKLCDKYHAPCGTSGGFFLYSEPGITKPSRRGDPVGLIVQDGVVTNPPVYTRSALIQDQKKQVFIRRIGMKGITIHFGKVKFTFRKVNASPLAGEISVFTRIHGEHTPRTGNLHFSIVGRTVVEVADEPIPIPINGFVVVVDSGGAELGLLKEIVPGLQIDYTLPSIPGVDKVVSAMAGGPALVINSRKTIDLETDQFGGGLPPVTFCEDSSIGQSLLPRMAWGITAKHELIACAVDGRNLDRSVGMTLKQLSSFLLQAGCVDAINLDGGSSKRMVVQGETVDIPSTGFILGQKEQPPKRLLSSAILVQRD